MSHAQALAGQFQVCLLDLRNHGRSPHAAEFDYDLMAGDVAEFARDRNFSSIHLLGHSMGGKVAMRFAQLYPDLTEKLIVADMAPRAYPPRYAEMLHTMHALDLSQFQQRSEVDAALESVAPDKAIRQFLLKNIGRDDAGQMKWKPNVAAIRANYHQIRAALPLEQTFTGPTLFVRGGKSDYVRSEDFDLIKNLFPAAKIETIPAAGHWLHAEAPSEFLRRITNFLSAAP